MEISIEGAEEKFTAHITQTANDRILFSGKFGTGKSYFLKKYFEKRKDEYNYIWLTPVNYVVGANQDIFEWIKIDIAKELISKEAFNKTNKGLNDNLIIQTYLHQNVSSIFADLLSAVSTATIELKTGIPIAEKLKKHFTAFKKFKGAIKEENKSDQEKILDFLNDSFQVKGSIYEDDLTTQIIRAAIELLAKKTITKTILIIDDLDRLDPEHVFRILNIFSVHNNHFDSNKFGFDKVIIVGDINNIESLYRYKNGEKTDFEGYIEKFFTYEPFYFSIIDSIINYCDSNSLDFNLDKYNLTVLKCILIELYKFDHLKIRNLKKVNTSSLDFTHLDIGSIEYHVPKDAHQYNEFHYSFTNSDNYYINLNRFDFIKVIFILAIATGGTDKLEEKLTLLHEQSDYFLSTKEINSFIHAISVVSHIAKNKGSNIFYSSYNAYAKENVQYTLGRQSQPIIKLGGVNLNFKFPWSSNNQYTGNNDYFENIELQNVDSKQRISFKQIIPDILHAISYLKSNSIIKNYKH